MADKLFYHGIHRAIRHRLTRPNAGATYMLRFDFDSNVMNFMRHIFAGRDVSGTCHADDCNFIFKSCVNPRLAEDSAEYKTIDNFVSNRVNSVIPLSNQHYKQHRNDNCKFTRKILCRFTHFK